MQCFSAVYSQPSVLGSLTRTSTATCRVSPMTQTHRLTSSEAGATEQANDSNIDVCVVCDGEPQWHCD
jgi:hypothetical protein